MAPLSNSARYFNSFYQPVNLSFYAEIFPSVDTKEISFLVLSNGIPYCGIKAYLHTQSDNSRQISCFGLPLLFLERLTDDHISLAASRRFVKSHFRTILEDFKDNLHVYYKDDLGNSLSPISSSYLKGANFLLISVNTLTSRSQKVFCIVNSQNLISGLLIGQGKTCKFWFLIVVILTLVILNNLDFCIVRKLAVKHVL